jgi:hypothetical protein
MFLRLRFLQRAGVVDGGEGPALWRAELQRL